jgi:hypothetical protein
MPIIRVEMFKGRTPQQKKAIARELIDGFIRGNGGGNHSGGTPERPGGGGGASAGASAPSAPSASPASTGNSGSSDRSGWDAVVPYSRAPGAYNNYCQTWPGDRKVAQTFGACLD